MKYIKTLFLKERLFLLAGGVIFLFILGFVFPGLFIAGKICLFLLFVLLVTDIILLYNSKDGIHAYRELAERFSNGDNNEVKLIINSSYPFNTFITIVDEIPLPFEKRDFQIKKTISYNQELKLTYTLRPVRRGKYSFGYLHIFATGFFKLASRRFSFEEEKAFFVYPSILQMKKYELQAVAGKTMDSGIKRIRKVGSTREFDQIREYIPGDDVRTLNWKATARRGNLMVNQYQEEKAQSIYFIIDKGRTMKSAFEELTLVDYAINATLAISNIALKKEDKVGLITYNQTVSTFLPSEKRTGQLAKIIQALYLEETSFVESNVEVLYTSIKNRIRHRSMLFIFSNFDTLSSYKRQEALLKKISKNHLLVIIFFENTELQKVLQSQSSQLEDIYMKITAEKLNFEKRLILKEMKMNGILSVLTTPQQLSVNIINKYLEIKARQLL